jgi:hypothetical protein
MIGHALSFTSPEKGFFFNIHDVFTWENKKKALDYTTQGLVSYICVCVEDICKPLHQYMRICPLYTHTHTHTHTHKHAHTCVHTYTYTYIRIHPCIYISLSLYMYIHMYIYIFMRIHMHSYIVCREHPSTHSSTHSCTHSCTHRHGLEVLGLESQYAAIGELDVVAASCIVVARGKAHSAMHQFQGLNSLSAVHVSKVVGVLVFSHLFRQV